MPVDWNTLIKEYKERMEYFRAHKFHIDAIMTEGDPRIIKIHLDCLSELQSTYENEVDEEATQMRIDDYARIFDKCKKLGLECPKIVLKVF